jgi:hypothetical protein
MTREEFDQLSEAEVRALLTRKAEALIADARTNDALRAKCERRFGEAPASSPLEDTLATTPDAATLLTLMERDAPKPE